MAQHLLTKPQALLRRLAATPTRWTRLLAAGLLVGGALGAQAQATTTIFNEDFESATNSFILENGTQVNQWFVGSVASNGPTAPGTKAAYISNDGGLTNTYTLTTASVTHLYRDVTLPTGQSVIQLGFDWKGVGESGYDYLLVQVAPTSFTPVAGTVPATTSVTLLAQLNLQTAFGRTTFTLPASLAGTTQRLIFTWRNDNTQGAQPPAVIDNISLTTRAASPFSGTYTINNALPTAGTNFTSFSDAATRLNNDGINGPVTLNVTGGPYTEQFLLGQVTGVSPANTITVNGGGRTLQFASSSSSQRAVVLLNGTKYTTINNLVIDATGGSGTSGTYGFGVLLTNAADYDKITNNTINADITTTSTNFTGIAVNGSTTSATTSGNSANGLLIEGNTVNGGYYGITLYGNSASSLQTGNIVRNNTVRDFYFYGLYVGYQDGVQLIGNDISRPLRTNGSTFYGLYLTGASRSSAVEKNRIHDPFTGSPASTGSVYGIYLTTSTGATATTSNDVVNNALYKLNGNGTHYCIYNSGAANSHIYNNTINSDDQTTSTSTTYGIYSSGTDGDIQNNAVSITRAGTGTKYGLYYTVARTISNYNDLFVPNGNVGYYSTAYATLAAWQASAGSFDANSISADPIFVNPSAGDLTPGNPALNNVGIPLARVTDDITGAPRGAMPDIGAYEFTPVNIDIAPVALLGPATGTACYSAAEAIIVQVRNNGLITLNFATNPDTLSVVVTLPGGTTQTFRGTVRMGTLAPGATQNVTLVGTLNMTALGTYSFAVMATVVGDQNTSNDLLKPTPTRTVVAPVAGTLSPASSSLCVSGTASLTLTGSANGSLQYQSSASATGPFANITGATSATYTTATLTSTTYFRVRTTCNANVVYSNVSAIAVNNPQVASTNTPVTICAGSTATLTATAAGNSSVRFFDTIIGGTPLATAGTYTTPALTANATYYVEAFAGSTENVGKQTSIQTDGGYNGSGTGLVFTTTGPNSIQSATVYNATATAGSVSVELRDNGTGNLITTVGPFAVPAGSTTTLIPTVLPLNLAIPAAGTYRLVTAATPTPPTLYRDFSTGNTFPYTSPSGAFTITGGYISGASTTYYFFYNLVVGSECISSASRTAIQVNVTQPPTATLTATPQSGGAMLLTASPVLTGATYQFFRNGVSLGAATTSNTRTLPSGSANGNYTVVITTSAGCASAPSPAVAIVFTDTRTATRTGVSLHVYPNPTPDGTLTLELTGPRAQAAPLTILDALGRVVHSSMLPAGSATLRLPGLAPGVYTLRVLTDEGALTERIVRQ